MVDGPVGRNRRVVVVTVVFALAALAGSVAGAALAEDRVQKTSGFALDTYLRAWVAGNVGGMRVATCPAHRDDVDPTEWGQLRSYRIERVDVVVRARENLVRATLKFDQLSMSAPYTMTKRAGQWLVCGGPGFAGGERLSYR